MREGFLCHFLLTSTDMLSSWSYSMDTLCQSLHGLCSCTLKITISHSSPPSPSPFLPLPLSLSLSLFLFLSLSLNFAVARFTVWLMQVPYTVCSWIWLSNWPVLGWSTAISTSSTSSWTRKIGRPLSIFLRWCPPLTLMPNGRLISQAVTGVL